MGSKIQGAFYIKYLLCCFNLKIILLSIHLNWGLCIKCPNRYRYLPLVSWRPFCDFCLNHRQNARYTCTCGKTQTEVIQKLCMCEETGGTLKVKVYQKPKTRNSENGNREWNANMAVKLFKNRKRKASRTSRILHTYKKEKATHHFLKQKPIVVWESTNCRKPEVNRRKTTGSHERTAFHSEQLLGERCHHGPQNLVGVGLQTFHFRV